MPRDYNNNNPHRPSVLERAGGSDELDFLQRVVRPEQGQEDAGRCAGLAVSVPV